MVVQASQIGLIFRLLPDHLLYHRLLQLSVLLVAGMAHVVLYQLPRITIYWLLVHPLLQKLCKIILVVIRLSGIYLRLLLLLQGH